jgi:hypothetical protein
MSSAVGLRPVPDVQSATQTIIAANPTKMIIMMIRCMRPPRALLQAVYCLSASLTGILNCRPRAPSRPLDEKELGGARSFISTYCGLAIDTNMSMCGGVRSRASYGYAEKK